MGIIPFFGNYLHEPLAIPLQMAPFPVTPKGTMLLVRHMITLIMYIKSTLTSFQILGYLWPFWVAIHGEIIGLILHCHKTNDILEVQPHFSGGTILRVEEKCR